MNTKYFSYYKISDKYELVAGIRIRNLVGSFRLYKFSKKFEFNFYKVSWPMDMDVLTLWKQIDWNT